MITRVCKALSRGIGKRSVGFWRRAAAASRRITSWAHYMQFYAEYAIAPSPEGFDAYMNQHWQWSATGESYWLERGVFNRLAMEPDARVLELCCGYGHYTKHFYALQGSQVIAVDFDPDAIARAKRYNAAANVEFRVADILTDLPDGPFDNVVWDSGIEHFTLAQLDTLLRQIKNRLSPRGILSGYTIAEDADSTHSRFHEVFFDDKEALARVLTPVFSNVKVFETFSRTRKNHYFYASDAVLPFDPEWAWMLLGKPTATVGTDGIGAAAGSGRG